MPRAGPMSIIPSNSAQDLRSHAVERKRDKENKSKWSPKWAATGVSAVKEGHNDTKRPRRLSKNAGKNHLRNAKEVRKTHQHKKLPSLNDDSASTDTSGHESIPADIDGQEHARDQDIPQACDMRGDDVLEMAVVAAVEQYEDKQTLKLINEEYEILATDHQIDANRQILDDDDDFELI